MLIKVSPSITYVFLRITNWQMSLSRLWIFHILVRLWRINSEIRMKIIKKSIKWIAIGTFTRSSFYHFSVLSEVWFFMRKKLKIWTKKNEIEEEKNIKCLEPIVRTSSVCEGWFFKKKSHVSTHSQKCPIIVFSSRNVHS